MQVEIDAIAISDSDEFVQFEINLAEDFQKETRKINLGTTVNSVYDEVAPIISPDGKTLYFTRMNHPENVRDNAHSKDKNVAQDIWLSRQLPSGDWSEAVNLGDPINTEEDNAAAAAHDNSLYILNVYLPDKKQKPGLSVTHYRNESWTFPQEIKIEGYEPKKEGNTGKITTEFATSPDREVMIIGYYGFETAGSNDLYVSFRKPDIHFPY